MLFECVDCGEVVQGFSEKCPHCGGETIEVDDYEFDAIDTLFF